MEKRCRHGLKRHFCSWCSESNNPSHWRFSPHNHREDPAGAPFLSIYEEDRKIPEFAHSGRAVNEFDEPGFLFVNK